ncbi:RING finger protein 145-like [Uloborus diversus]|uniref:RING finger protein 145-like n=1 Tax=Uloborus diversus TaxID=327109 RepID=UPI00240945B6|nr:RING finger protein 145-like [Uloborus diversus]
MEAAISAIMRVPGLFIIDYWWQHDTEKSLPYSLDMDDILKSLAINVVLLYGFFLLLLPLQHVKTLYTHLIGGAIIVTCHVVSAVYVNIEAIRGTDSAEDSVRQISMLMLQIFLGFLISYLLKWKSYPQIFSLYSLPVIARLLDQPIDIIFFCHNFCRAATAFGVISYIIYHIPKVLNGAKSACMDALTVMKTYGVGTLFTVLWNKLFVPPHFALFWLIEFTVKLIGTKYRAEKLAWGDEWYMIVLTTVSSICSSPVTLLATSVTVSYVSFFTLCSVKAYLQGFSAFFRDNPMHSGWTEGFTLILLSIQTGLIEMKMPARMVVMTVILFIVLSSLLQSMLEIAEPVVLSLSASRSRNHWRHFRALSLCLTLLIFPLYLTKVLSGVFPIDFWMLVVLSSCALTSVQVFDLLVVHSLFLYDSAKVEPWENLDDIVYYTRAVTKVFEFFVAIFVVGMGLWESTAGKWNLVNASILMVHCYFNVWQRLQTGWQSFLLRREAAKKAKSLPSATEEQLTLLDDVCSICYGSMKSACVTLCQHYFHRTCLRKWLYVQDKCPLCHSVISLSSDDIKTPQSPDPPREVNNGIFLGPFF